jgi:hypothetical protein
MPSILDTTFSAIPLTSNIFRELPEARPGTKLSTGQIIERLFDSDFVYLIAVLFTRPLDDTEAEVIIEVDKGILARAVTG